MSERFNEIGMGLPAAWYDRGCRRCERLAGFLDEVSARHEDYFCGPVPPFGDVNAELLVVGLAPGMHGANATGRPFTGDHAGLLLYQTLYKFGFASKPESLAADDELVLHNCRITNAVKCLPPQNKPVGAEEKNCNPFLASEIGHPRIRIILALGQLAHRAILRALGIRHSLHRFAHNALHDIGDGKLMVNSYHCSRYNTQTRRLTTPMFENVFEQISREIKRGR